MEENMHRSSTGRAALVSIAVAMLAFTGCGGGNKTTSTLNKVFSGQVTRNEALPPAKTATYSANLAGFSGGSPNGSGLAVININAATDQLCWSFYQLKNLPSPTVARIFRNFPGAEGTGGYLLGSHYTPSGCIHKPALTLALIESRPEEFYVNVHTKQFPEGAARGAL
jgi:hypothetical protein